MADLDLSDHTILVVDDEQFSRSIIARLLERMGRPKIHTAEDGTEALALLKSFPNVSLIVSDFKMPLLDGLLLLRCVRSGEAGIDRATPFAMVTGFSDNALVDTAIDLDVNAFLIKPVSSTALSRRLGSMLNTASDGSWLKPAEEYVQIEVSSTADPKRAVPRSAPTGSAPQRPTVHGRRLPAARARPSAKVSARHKKQHKKVYGRLSGLKGKFKNSDLAGDISVGVSTLIEEVGADNANEVISVFDDLEKRGQFKLDEIAGVLSSGPRRFSEQDLAGPDRSRPASTSRRGKPARPAAGKTADGAAKELQLKFTDGTESFCTLDAIPDSAVLARDINTVDGRLFIKAGIDVTPLIASIFTYLDSLGVLGLEKRGDAEFSGIYVRMAEARPDDKTAPEGEAADVTKTISGGSSKTVSVTEVLPGSILAHDVYTTDGRSYLPAGADLTPRITTLLRDLYELGTIPSEVRIVG